MGQRLEAADAVITLSAQDTWEWSLQARKAWGCHHKAAPKVSGAAKPEGTSKLLSTCSSRYRELLGPEGKGGQISSRLHRGVEGFSEDPQAYPVVLHSSRWLYEGLSREKAEELLLLPGNPGGAFLIRESQTRRGG